MKSLLSFTFILGGLAASALFGASSDTTVGAADSQFAMNAASGGLAEVQLGQLALKNASSDGVKTFAQKMIDDHTQANDKLKQIAAKANISLPSSMNAKDQAIYDRLAKLQGAQFDKAYMQDMVKDHKGDIAEFHKEANNGKNSELKSFAADTLPTLQQHLTMAQETYSKIK